MTGTGGRADSIKIEVADTDDVKIVRFEGSLDTYTTPKAQQHLQEILDQGARKVLFDFQDLKFLSSTGLGILLMTAKKLGSCGGTLRMCNPNETVGSILELSGFGTLFSIFDNETDALVDF
jgi:anti-anti-sigma factor